MTSSLFRISFLPFTATHTTKHSIDSVFSYSYFSALSCLFLSWAWHCGSLQKLQLTETSFRCSLQKLAYIHLDVQIPVHVNLHIGLIKKSNKKMSNCNRVGSFLCSCPTMATSLLYIHASASRCGMCFVIC